MERNKEIEDLSFEDLVLQTLNYKYNAGFIKGKIFQDNNISVDLYEEKKNYYVKIINNSIDIDRGKLVDNYIKIASTLYTRVGKVITLILIFKYGLRDEHKTYINEVLQDNSGYRFEIIDINEILNDAVKFNVISNNHKSFEEYTNSSSKIPSFEEFIEEKRKRQTTNTPEPVTKTETEENTKIEDKLIQKIKKFTTVDNEKLGKELIETALKINLVANKNKELYGIDYISTNKRGKTLVHVKGVNKLTLKNSEEIIIKYQQLINTEQFNHFILLVFGNIEHKFKEKIIHLFVNNNIEVDVFDIQWVTKILSENPELNNKWFSNDYKQNPSTIANYIKDGTEGEDYLGIDKDVTAFAKVIASASFKPPLAIALFGHWGMGKVSL